MLWSSRSIWHQMSGMLFPSDQPWGLFFLSCHHMKVLTHCNVARWSTETPAFWISLFYQLVTFLQLSENKFATHAIVFITWCYHGNHILTGMLFKISFFLLFKKSYLLSAAFSSTMSLTDHLKLFFVCFNHF